MLTLPREWKRLRGLKAPMCFYQIGSDLISFFEELCMKYARVMKYSLLTYYHKLLYHLACWVKIPADNILKYFYLFLLARLYESTGRAITLSPVSALALASVSLLTKMLKFYVKVFYKTSYFLNPLTDLVYIWYNYRCWSKILLSPIHNPAHGLKA